MANSKHRFTVSYEGYLRLMGKTYGRDQGSTVAALNHLLERIEKLEAELATRPVIAK